MHTLMPQQEKQMKDVKEASKEGFDMEDGPFIKALDNTLGAMNVHRQAYYGGTFIGNHAHKCLKVVLLILLCKDAAAFYLL